MEIHEHKIKIRDIIDGYEEDDDEQSSKDLKTSNKKPSKRRGRQDKDWKTVNASIP